MINHRTQYDPDHQPKHTEDAQPDGHPDNRHKQFKHSQFSDSFMWFPPGHPGQFQDLPLRSAADFRPGNRMREVHVAIRMKLQALAGRRLDQSDIELSRSSPDHY